MAIYDKASVISDNKRNDKDTGSADVQVAILTTRINLLTEHLKKSSKDHSSRRGLIIMVSKRRKLLDYITRTDRPRYEALIKKLNVRK
ncbi:MAG: 30S ribosomal protein S15 [Blastochloris sp.]|jgi:small subunit ribosomal protein S15|nr:30S ribosomal protein S15 [Blastochloris sp.]